MNLLRTLNTLLKFSKLTPLTERASAFLIPSPDISLARVLLSAILSTISIALELFSIFLLIPLSHAILNQMPGISTANTQAAQGLTRLAPLFELSFLRGLINSFWQILAVIILVRSLQIFVEYLKTHRRARLDLQSSDLALHKFTDSLARITTQDLQANNVRIAEAISTIPRTSKELIGHLELLCETSIRATLYLLAVFVLSPMAAIGMALSLPAVIKVASHFLKTNNSNAKKTETLSNAARVGNRSLLDNLTTVRAFEASPWMAERIHLNQRELLELERERSSSSNRFEKIQRSLFLLSAIVITALISTSHTSYQRGIDLTICIYLLSLSLPISGQIGQLIAKAGSLNERIANITDLLDLITLDPSPVVSNEIDLDKLSAIEVRGLSISFGSLNLLKNVELTLNRGYCYHLSGASGSGKSTLLRAIANLYHSPTPSIFVKANELDVPLTAANSDLIYYQDQEPLLFDLSIRENILFGNDSTIADSEMLNLLDDLKLGLPQNGQDILDRQIVNGGRELSRGQRQKILIARAFFSRQKILLLDEPFSSMDRPSIERSKEYLRQRLLDAIAIIASHHPLDGLNNPVNITLDGGRIKPS